MSNVDPGSMRAGTADRDACAQVLNDALAQGRLTPAEHDERMSRCFAAVTMGDLAGLTADLPSTGAAAPPVATPAATPAVTPRAATDGTIDRAGKSGLKGMWFSWLGVSVLVTVIWGLTALSGEGPVPYFWPMWVIGPWGAVNAMVTLTSLAGKK